MGYLSRVTGRIEITPPLPWSAVQDSKFLPDRANTSGLDVRYEITECAHHSDHGVFLARTAVAVVSTWEDSTRAYGLEKHLADISAEITAVGSTCTGYLVRSGADQGDVERYSINANEVVTECASLRWPDGSEVTE